MKVQKFDIKNKIEYESIWIPIIKHTKTPNKFNQMIFMHSYKYINNVLTNNHMQSY